MDSNGSAFSPVQHRSYILLFSFLNNILNQATLKLCAKTSTMCNALLRSIIEAGCEEKTARVEYHIVFCALGILRLRNKMKVVTQ